MWILILSLALNGFMLIGQSLRNQVASDKQPLNGKVKKRRYLGKLGKQKNRVVDDSVK